MRFGTNIYNFTQYGDDLPGQGWSIKGR